jgi:hypothetical protein
MNNMLINYRNPNVVRKAGMSALKKELGTVGAAYFMRQFSTGQGDYTCEREKLIEGIAFDDIVNNVRELDRKTTEV